GFELRFGIPFEHFGVTVAVDHDASGGPCVRHTGPCGGDQLGQFGIRIFGHQQPRVGARRQAETIFNLLNCAFMRFASATFQVTQAHDADTRGHREVCQRPVARLAQSPNGGACRLPAHRRAPTMTGYYTASSSTTYIYVFIHFSCARTSCTYTFLSTYSDRR